MTWLLSIMKLNVAVFQILLINLEKEFFDMHRK